MRRESGKKMADANLGHGVRMDGRRHSHDHCLHYGSCYCRCRWCQVSTSGVDNVCSRVDKISFYHGELVESHWDRHMN